MKPLHLSHPALVDVRKARTERDRLLEEIARLKTAAIPDDELRAKVDASLSAATATLRERVNLGGIRQPGRADDDLVLSHGMNLGTATLLAVLQLPGLADLIVAEAKRVNPAPAGPPALARAKQVAKLTERLAAVEEAEERAILAVEAAGHAVTRRDDVDPKLLVRLWSEEPAGEPVGDEAA
jgi:hypothetical protein